jgi:hypothetical protein
VTGRRGRRRKQILGEHKGKKGCWKLKDEALDSTIWRTRLGRDYGRFGRETTEGMNECNRVLLDNPCISWTLDHEDGSTTLFRNVCYYIPVYTL